MSNEASSLQNALSELQESHDTLDADLRSVCHSENMLQDKLESSERAQADLLRALEQLKADLSSSRTSTSELQSINAELEASNQKLQQAANHATSPSSDLIKHELTRQVTHLKSLEASNARLTRENAILKQRDLDLDLLKEEKASLEKKLKPLMGLRRDLAETESEVQRLLREKEEWTVYLINEGQEAEGESPRDVAKALAKERIANASLRERVGEMQSGLKRRDGLVQEYEERVDEMEAIVRSSKDEKRKINDALRRSKNEVGLLEKERDFLKTQLVCQITDGPAVSADHQYLPHRIHILSKKVN